MIMRAILPAAVLAVAAAAAAPAAPGDVDFPPDAGLIDVTQPPYNAKGDGRTDDTAAINKAVQAYPNGGVIIYLPKGTYLISDTIKWPKGPRGWEWKNIKLRGQNRARTVIRLKDACRGYTDPGRPKAMIWTGPPPEQRFHNAIENLTVHTGLGNRGAIGVQFNASNTGRMVGVTIRSGDGQGVYGLDMGYCNQIGPLLIKDVKIVGFHVGIRTKYAINSQTFVGVTLHGQGRCGWLNEGQVVNVERLEFVGRAPAIRNSGRLTLVGGRLIRTVEEEAADEAAITNGVGARLYVRDLRTSGYRAAIDQMKAKPGRGAKSKAEVLGRSVEGPNVAEWLAGEARQLFAGPKRSLRLPIEAPPEVPWDPVEAWANVQDYGAKVTGMAGNEGFDSRPAIQKAIDSGKTTVYCPNNHPTKYPSCRGGYRVSAEPIRVRGKVRRLIGCEANLVGLPKYWEPTEVVVEDGDSPVVVIERLSGKTLRIKTDRTVVLRHCQWAIFCEGAGKVFIEDVCGAPIRIGKGCRVWARQLDPELWGKRKTKWGPHVVNDGGTLWLLGMKTEGGDTLIETKNGGATEVLGAHWYSAGHTGNTKPMLINNESAVSIIGFEAQFAGPKYQTYVRETRGGVTKELKRSALPWNCGSGMAIPLYAGFSEAAARRLSRTAP
jgi:hypothetical protein